MITAHLTLPEAKTLLHNAKVDVLRWSDEEPDAIKAAKERVEYFDAIVRGYTGGQ